MLTRRAFLSDTLIAMTAAGCSRSDAPPGSQGPQRTAEGSPPAIATSTSRLKLTAASNDGVLCYVDWWVAAYNGFFFDEGLDVVLLEQDPSGAHSHGLVSSWLKGPTGLVRTDLMPVEYSSLVDMVSGQLTYSVVAGEHSGCRQIVVPVNSPIQTVSELRGKRIGLFHNEDTLAWEQLLGLGRPGIETVRWVPHSVTTPGLELERIRREFAAGEIDAYAGPDPIPEILKAEGVARLIASSTWTPPLNGWYCCMLAVRTELVDAHPELPRSFTRAIRRAAAVVQANPADAISLAVDKGHLPPSTPRDVCARLLKEYVWTTTGRIQEDLERYFEFLIDAGRLPGTMPARAFVQRVYRSGD